MKIEFIGGVRQVTGSCYYLEINSKRLLIECGMTHNNDDKLAINFDFSEIDFILLSHAHIDHSGLIPYLIKKGFKGKIHCTHATAELLMIMLKDSAYLQKKDAEWLTKKEQRAGRDVIIEPLYSIDDVSKVSNYLYPVSYNTIITLTEDIKTRFIDAGHILGSASIELWCREGNLEKKIVFSGDIGKKNNPLVKDPQNVDSADVVLIESTYGNRLHRNKQESIDELVDVINNTIKNNGNVLIPSFAIGRTQDLIFVLHKLSLQGRLIKHRIFIDSPLAKEATLIYSRHKECLDEEAIIFFENFKRHTLNITFTESLEESQKINEITSGAIIIAGSGMCEGGRIRHHFKHNIWRKQCSIVFVGFQATGTLGRRIIDGAKNLKILGEEIAVRSSVHTIGGFSAHADRDELLDWLKVIKNRGNPLKVCVVHGEEETSLKFCNFIKDGLKIDATVPKQHEVISF